MDMCHKTAIDLINMKDHQLGGCIYLKFFNVSPMVEDT